MVDIITVNCPQCNKEFLWDLDNPNKTPYRPFCSKVCKSYDLLAWAKDEYRISTKSAQDEE